MIACFGIGFHFNILEEGTDYLKTHEFYTFASQLRPGSLVNRASDSGSEGRGFESHPGHG